MNLKASVARELLKGRPEPVFRRVALNSAFRQATGLDLRADPHGLPRGELLKAVQKAAQGQDVTVEDRSGIPVHVHSEDNRIFIRRLGADGTETRFAPGDLQFLSLDPAIRRKAFLELAAQFGATGPKPDHWLPRLEARPATTDELDVLYGEMRTSLTQWRIWISEKIDGQRALISDLTPNESGYFSSLCGPPPSDMPPEEWIAGPLAEHRRRLVTTDLVSGLAAILPGSIRHDLGPAALVADLNDEVVWAAIQALPDFIDPFSLLGLLDIALSRRDRHSGFSDMAEMLVQALLAEPFRRPDGMDLSRFYPGLVATCLKSLRRTEGLAATPPCWQRLCAFTHAGHLLEIFGRLDFDVDVMTNGLPLGATPFDILGELLNCRTSPMWTADNLNGERIRAEVLGRLALLRSQELSAGRTFPHDDMVAAAVEKAGIATAQPGPLEGHMRPTFHFPNRVIPEESEKKALEGVAADPRTECGNILSLAGLVSLGLPLLKEAVSATGFMPLEGENPTDALGPLMFLALTATRQADCSLSDAVAERCIRESRNLTTANKGLERCDLLFRVLLAASTAQPEWSAWFASKLVSLTLAMPPGPWLGHVEILLVQMKQLLPLTEWRFGRATAYARLGRVA